jgi:hypothetical protein
MVEGYGFDDTPKAFKRMLQRKDEIFGKRNKSSDGIDTSAVHHGTKRSFESVDTSKSTVKTSQKLHKAQNVYTTTTTSTNATAATKTKNTATNNKTLRAKRKAHLQSRDLKKKQKRQGNVLDQTLHGSLRRTDVRDVVQEPPKLAVKPKKTFKRVLDDQAAVKAWEEDDEYDGNDNDHNEDLDD